MWHFTLFPLSTFSLLSLAFFRFPFLGFKTLTMFPLFLSLFPLRHYFIGDFDSWRSELSTTLSSDDYQVGLPLWTNFWVQNQYNLYTFLLLTLDCYLSHLGNAWLLHFVQDQLSPIDQIIFHIESWAIHFERTCPRFKVKGISLIGLELVL